MVIKRIGFFYPLAILNPVAATFFFKPNTHLKEHQRKNETADTKKQKFEDWFKAYKNY